jgi:hypothetical protein
MHEEAVSETVTVQLPRWRLGPWRWGPLINARLIIIYQPTRGFATRVEGLHVPDRDQRFASILMPIRHALLRRHESLESITRQHRTQTTTTLKRKAATGTARIATSGHRAGTAESASRAPRAPLPPGAPGTAGPIIAPFADPPPAPAAAPAPAPAAVARQPTGIFRMPKEDISTRILRVRDQRTVQPATTQTPAWLAGLERDEFGLIKEVRDRTGAKDLTMAPTYTVIAEAPASQTTSSIFRLDKGEITERLGRRRRGEIPPPDEDGIGW